jgi:uncharacterized membrane protein HdeD (DUF308 family)
MLSKMVNRWWVVLVRGICAILFGIFALTRPGLSLWTLILVYGILAFADGAAGIALGFGGKLDGKPWWERIAGSFDKDPVYAKAMKLGRAYRESQRPRKPSRSRD